MATWSVSHPHPRVHIVDVSLNGRNDTFDAFVSSDWHWDHPHCNRRILKSDLDEAIAVDAPIFCFGDALCLMQLPADRRMQKGKTRPEHEREDYLDAITDDLADWLEPYKANLALLGMGNHESSVVKHHGVNVLAHAASKLQQRGAPWVGAGAYEGYVRFQFRRGEQRQTIDLYYHHGFGGSAPVTRGTLKVNRLQMIAEAQIYVSGHDHNLWMMPTAVHKLSQAGVIYTEMKRHIHTGSYKSASSDAASLYSWEVEKTGGGPLPIGGWFLRFFMGSEEARNRVVFKTREPLHDL